MNIKYVNVTFFNGGTEKYSYMTYLDLHKGDYVVVEAKGDIELAYVREVIEPTSIATKWVVAKVDLKKHKQIVESIKL